MGATQYGLSPCFEMWGLWYEVFNTNPLLKLHFASHFICFFYPFRLCQEGSSHLDKMSMCIRSRTMCPHLGGVMTHPWMVKRLQTLCTELVFGLLRCDLAAEIKLEHEQSAENT